MIEKIAQVLCPASKYSLLIFNQCVPSVDLVSREVHGMHRMMHGQRRTGSPWPSTSSMSSPSDAVPSALGSVRLSIADND